MDCALIWGSRFREGAAGAAFWVTCACVSEKDDAKKHHRGNIPFSGRERASILLNVMPPAHRSTRAPSSSGSADVQVGVSVEALAHELNSLLDGSMRCLRLARSAINDGQSPSDVERRLETALSAMQSMAAMLDRAMRRPEAGLEIFRSDRRLAEEIDRLIELVGPLAGECGVRLTVSLTDEVGSLPAGPLGPALANALRNAVQAIERSGAGHGAVSVTGAIIEADTLLLRITDDGPGLGAPNPAGQGLGLPLARQIVEGLRGRLEMMDPPAGHGVTVQIRVPLASLTST